MLSGCARAREVPDKLSGQFVYVDAPKIVELLTPKTENSRTADRRDVDAFAVEYIAVHDLPPIARGPAAAKAALVGRR
jgi:hypothetical protein